MPISSPRRGAKRSLFSGPRYRLIDVHKRLRGCEPETSHYAEADTLALLSCAVASGKDFVDFVTSDAKLFADVNVKL